MKKYLVKRRYLCEDGAFVEANSKAEALEKFDEIEVGTRVIKTYVAKIKKAQAREKENQ